MLLTWWFSEVYLHDCDQWGVQVVSLGFLCVENLHRVRPARNGENGLYIPTPSYVSMQVLIEKRHCNTLQQITQLRTGQRGYNAVVKICTLVSCIKTNKNSQACTHKFLLFNAQIHRHILFFKIMFNAQIHGHILKNSCCLMDSQPWRSHQGET